MSRKKAYEFPQIQFHHASSNEFVYIDGQKFPSLPKCEKERTCPFHKDLPEFVTSQYTQFSYMYKEEKCILCKNFQIGSDNRDVHVRCEKGSPRRAGALRASKSLPLKLHSPATSQPKQLFKRSHGPPHRRSDARHKTHSYKTHSYLPQNSPTRMSKGHQTNSTNTVQSRISTSQEYAQYSRSSRAGLVFPPFEEFSRKYNSPVDPPQPMVKVNYLLSNLRPLLDPVYVPPILQL